MPWFVGPIMLPGSTSSTVPGPDHRRVAGGDVVAIVGASGPFGGVDHDRVVPPGSDRLVRVARLQHDAAAVIRPAQAVESRVKPVPFG